LSGKCDRITALKAAIYTGSSDDSLCGKNRIMRIIIRASRIRIIKTAVKATTQIVRKSGEVIFLIDWVNISIIIICLLR